MYGIRWYVQKIHLKNTFLTIYDYYKSLGVETVFEMNPGNHFQDAAQRIAKGIVWLVMD